MDRTRRDPHLRGDRRRSCAAAATVGVRSIRLTGGEPLVRRDLHRLVAMIAAIPGIDDIALSTNGLLLNEQIAELARRRSARASTSRSTRCARIASKRSRAGRGSHRVLDGIDAAFAARPRADQDQLRRDARAERRRDRGVRRTDARPRGRRALHRSDAGARKRRTATRARTSARPRYSIESRHRRAASRSTVRRATARRATSPSTARPAASA